MFIATSDEFIIENKLMVQQSLKNKKIQIFFKHLFDIVASLILISLFSPIFIVISIIIKVTSSGPVFYSGYRIGYRGKYFKCFKFRSMLSFGAASDTIHSSLALIQMEKGMVYKVKNDSRITVIGKFIRKTSIDELPQLFNVLLGDMSIVGPRAAPPYFLKDYKEFSDIRCLLKPGITGLWQICDREHNTSANFMVEYDLDYIKNYSLYLDLKILLRTPLAVLSCKGAY